MVLISSTYTRPNAHLREPKFYSLICLVVSSFSFLPPLVFYTLAVIHRKSGRKSCPCCFVAKQQKSHGYIWWPEGPLLVYKIELRNYNFITMDRAAERVNMYIPGAYTVGLKLFSDEN